MKHPVVLHSVDPELPKDMKGTHMVLVSLTIDEQGLPNDARVLRADGPEFVDPALNAIKQFRFKPATLDGVPVSVKMNIELRFQRFGF